MEYKFDVNAAMLTVDCGDIKDFIVSRHGPSTKSISIRASGGFAGEAR